MAVGLSASSINNQGNSHEPRTRDEPAAPTLGDSLRRAAQAAADKPAVIFYGTDGAAQTYSYAQLNALVNTVANNLLRRGIRKGDRVAALSRNNVPFLALGYALHKIGAWLVPVNFMLQPADVRH
ncbi:MAG: AMP-binding protein, partial [Gammaproteobacteria bacterium]